jgi:FkbM family methyltransferase
VRRIVAFEPDAEHASALAVSAALNRAGGQVDIRRKALAETAGHRRFVVSPRCRTSSHLAAYEEEQQGETIECSTLDIELLGTSGESGETVVLIDVEGGELAALQGGAEFIRRRRPLIIFEYHEGTKKIWQLPQLAELLGASYSFFRLRKDGKLDRDCDHAWNCVACCEGSPFWDLCLAASVTNENS